LYELGKVDVVARSSVVIVLTSILWCELRYSGGG
jgi:hypothetical protein